MNRERPFVYIASAYSRGDQAVNTHFQCRIWDELMNAGLVWPYAPLMSHFQHTLFPRKYTDWTDYDNAIIPRMDACLRLTAVNHDMGYTQMESSGADAEVELFESLGKPVFYSITEMNRWVLSLAKAEGVVG